MCGIIGIFKHEGSANAELYEGLLMLQHRGQDSAGMVTTDWDRFKEYKENGLVKDVFSNQGLMDSMKGGWRAWVGVRRRGGGATQAATGRDMEACGRQRCAVCVCIASATACTCPHQQVCSARCTPHATSTRVHAPARLPARTHACASQLAGWLAG